MTDENLNQVAHGLKSVQLEDEDASKYFINYISDESDVPVDEERNQRQQETQSIGEEENHQEIDVAALPSSLIITPVPQDLFTNQELKDEFEQLFRIHDPDITVLYLKFFQRVRITFTSPYNALEARLHLHESAFHGATIKTYFACPIVFRGANPDSHLRPPEPDKLFLISPPSSPPVGWEQKLEDPPVVDLNLIAAIAQLQPNERHELLPRDHATNAPSIIIHTCDDVSNATEIDQRLRAKLVRPTLVQTKRPPSS